MIRYVLAFLGLSTGALPAQAMVPVVDTCGGLRLVVQADSGADDLSAPVVDVALARTDGRHGATPDPSVVLNKAPQDRENTDLAVQNLRGFGAAIAAASDQSNRGQIAPINRWHAKAVVLLEGSFAAAQPEPARPLAYVHTAMPHYDGTSGPRKRVDGSDPSADFCP